jgi:hypothetical protein
VKPSSSGTFLALKVSGSLSKGYDWFANDYTELAFG